MSEIKQVSGQSYTFFRVRIYNDQTRIIEYKKTGEGVAIQYHTGEWLVDNSRDIVKFNDNELLELMRIAK